MLARDRCLSWPAKLRPVFGAFVRAAAAVGFMPPAEAAASQGNWWVYVQNDNAAEIRELLAGGADPNVHYKNGQPALMRAVVDGAWQVFDILAADPRIQLEDRKSTRLNSSH